MSDTQPTITGEVADVVIIGGGIAGSAAAITLAQAGLDVVLVEREPEFRDRIRGESIHPWGVRELNALGLRDIVIDHAGGRELPRWTRYRSASLVDSFAWADLMPGSPGEISVRHPVLQSALLNAARDAGVHVFRPATVGPWRDGKQLGVSINAGNREFEVRCRLLIGADGQRSAVRSWIGGTARRDPIHHAIGGAIVSGIELPEDSAHQAFFEGGFAMVFPQSGNTSRIYYVCSIDEAAALQRAQEPASIMSKLIDIFPSGVIRDWANAGPAGFFPNADSVVDRIATDDVLLIGDAAGVNDPSQGHGISLAFRDVRELRTLLTSTADWSGIPARFAETRQHYFETLRQHARWSAPLLTDIGPNADALRLQVARARKQDPTAGGFAGIFVTGPDGLVADEKARRHFFGEDIDFAHEASPSADSSSANA